MLLHVREAAHGLWTRVDTREIARTSRMVSRLTGYQVQPNKAIVGRNAFAHESGIHQDGVLKERTTYEIMDATTIGLEANSLVLGKHSGRHALRNALEELGFKVDGRGAQHRLQALQGAGGQEEEGHGARPRGDRLGRDEAGAGGVRAGLVRHRGVVHALPARARERAAARRRGRVRQLHGRRPGRRLLQRAQRGHRPRGAATRVPRLGGDRRARRARRGDRPARAGRPACRPASGCPPTSSRRPARPTCARCRTPWRRTSRPRRSAARARGEEDTHPVERNTIAAPWPPSPSRCETVNAPSASGRARRPRHPVCSRSTASSGYTLLTTPRAAGSAPLEPARDARGAAGARGRDLGRAPARGGRRAAGGARRRPRDRHRQGDRRRHRGASGGDPDHAVRRRAHAVPPHPGRGGGCADGPARRS